MARIRYIKPEFFMDERVSELPPDAQLLFIGLWCLADKEGRLEDRPRYIKASLFPYRDVDVEVHLDALIESGRIVRYEADGKRCIAIPNFGKHQKPHPKERSYGLPAPDEGVATPGAVKFHGRVRKVPGPHAHPAEKGSDEAGGNGEWGMGMGNGDRDGKTPSEEPSADAPAPAGEGFSLIPTEPQGKKPRRPSFAESLYARCEQGRQEACEATGADYVPEGWHHSRQNKQLGFLAKASDAERARFEAAWEAYLDEPANAARDPAFSLGYFLATRSTWESKAKRAGGGT